MIWPHLGVHFPVQTLKNSRSYRLHAMTMCDLEHTIIFFATITKHRLDYLWLRWKLTQRCLITLSISLTKKHHRANIIYMTGFHHKIYYVMLAWYAEKFEVIFWNNVPLYSHIANITSKIHWCEIRWFMLI